MFPLPRRHPRRLAALLALCALGCRGTPVDGDADTDSDGMSTDRPLDSDTSADSDVPVDTDATITPQDCDDPSARADGSFANTVWLGSAPGAPVDHLAALGVAVEDLDGDGHLDMLRALSTGVHVHWGSAAGPSPTGSPLGPDLEDASAVYAVDLDGDGTMEVLVLRWNRQNVLFTQTGPRAFERRISGLEGDPETHNGAAIGDVDGDGRLDVVISTFGAVPADRSPLPEEAEPTYLFLQGEDGTFRLASIERMPPSTYGGHSWAVALSDHDDDGDLDIYVLNDFPVEAWGNRLYRNDGEGRFTWLQDAGLEAMGSGMGFASGDLDNDLDLDWVVAGWEEMPALLQFPGLQHVDASQALGIVAAPERGQEVAWALDLEDIDHDGDLDLFTGFGFLPLVATDGYLATPNPLAQPNALFIQSEGYFRDAAPELGVDHDNANRGGGFYDVDGDGWVDLVEREHDGRIGYTLQRCGDATWTDVALSQPGPNPRGIGAQLLFTVGERSWIREIHIGHSIATSFPPTAHLGLGEAEQVDSIVVRWPDGGVDVFMDVPANARLVLERGGAVRGR